MMDPSIGWFQPEAKGPAQELWTKCWNEFTASDKSSDISTYDNYTKIVSKLCGHFPQLKDNPSSIYDLENNKHLICKYEGIPWRLSKDKRLYEGIDGLHQEIQDFYEYMKPKAKEYEIRVGVQTRITQIIEHLWPDAVVECFGSFKTNTFLPTSDIDLVVINHRWTYLPLIELEQHFLCLKQCLPQQIRVLDRAAVPIIKMTDLNTGIRINISFNMPQVVKSVNLVNDYLKELPNATKLLFVIKQFVLQRDLNEVFRGGLSSYSLVLMVIHFFKTNPDTQVDPNNDNMGDLLMRFLDLYGRRLNYDKVGLKVKDGIFVKKCDLLAHMDSGHDLRHPPSLLCIEDPLNEKNNVSKNSYNVEKIRDAFRYAFETLDRAVGPNQLTVGKTESILGRIVRVTDDVVDKREALLHLYLNIRLGVVYTHQYYNPYKPGRGHNRNRGNRGNKRWNNRNSNNWNNQNRNNGIQQHRANSQQCLQQTDTKEVENSQQSNGSTNSKPFPNRNGFRRFERTNGHNGFSSHPSVANNHQKFSHQNSRYGVIYYSFDRNPNQHKERAQQQEEDVCKTGATDVKDHKPFSEMNGTSESGPEPEFKAFEREVGLRQRLRSNTCE